MSANAILALPSVVRYTYARAARTITKRVFAAEALDIGDVVDDADAGRLASRVDTYLLGHSLKMSRYAVCFLISRLPMMRWSALIYRAFELLSLAI